MLVVDVDDDGFIGFGARAALVLAIEDTGAADAEFETLAAHRLDQHAELKLAATRDLETVLVGAFGDADRNVGLRLTQPPVAAPDRKSRVEGRKEAVRVYLGGHRQHKK